MDMTERKEAQPLADTPTIRAILHFALCVGRLVVWHHGQVESSRVWDCFALCFAFSLKARCVAIVPSFLPSFARAEDEPDRWALLVLAFSSRVTDGLLSRPASCRMGLQ